MKFVHMLFGLLMALCSAVTFAQAIDINTASAEQLEKAIKGIGPTKAAAIVKYRETTGPFKSVDDLTKVPGIKDKALEKLLADNKEMLTVGGAVPATAVPAVTAPAMPVAPVPATPTIPVVPATPAAPVPAAPAAPAAPVAPAK